MIKNIIFDVDGVLVDCNQCYVEFLKNTYEEFRNITSDDLPVLFPINPNNGCVELPPNLSEDFKQNPYYVYRPLFSDTLTVLNSLKKKGFNLFTLSAARNPDKKLEWISKAFRDIFTSFEFSPAGKTKEEALKGLLEKYALDKNETIFVDDRFPHIRAGINVGIHTVRMQPKNSLPLSDAFKNVKSVKTLTEFEEYVNTFNSRF